MGKSSGRDQREPMERLVRLAAVLQKAGARGVLAERLAEVAGFTGNDRVDQVARDLRFLKRQGWQIDQVADEGEPARYVMTTVDNRLRVTLTPDQQRALQRAVLLADRSDLVARLGLPQSERPPDLQAGLPLTGHDATLSTVLRAVQRNSRLRFRYKGRQRCVHPQSLRTQNGSWYLRAVEDDQQGEQVAEQVKVFVVSRMDDVTADPPGTARRLPRVEHTGLHPMTWQVDPPVEVTLRTSPDFRPDVERWLGRPARVTPAGDEVEMTYDVTHRAALRTRLYELGPRVRLVGPPEIRDEVIAELEAIAAGGERS